MEENKNKNEQVAQGGNGGGRRRRNHGKHRHGNGNNGGNGGGQNTPLAQNGQNRAAQGQATPNAQGGGNKPQQAQSGKPQGQNPQGGKAQGQNSQNGQGKKGGQPQPQQKNKNQGNKNGGNGNNGGKQNGQKEDNRKDTYLYTLDGNLYVNLTNKCSNGCDFCVRNERTSYYGNYLWLRHGEPSAEKVIADSKGFGDLTRFKEVVFCGFGEPTYRVAEMVALCDYFHEKGLKTRLNTNGQGNLINKRDIVPDLKGKLDFINVSLNASCYEKYQAICRSQFKEAGFDGMIEFAKSCRRNGIDCRLSIVDCIGEEEVEACKKLAQSINVPLYIRNYITDS